MARARRQEYSISRSVPVRFDGFGTETCLFLSDLAQNNDREWFQRNKPRYETQVREPSMRFIDAIRPGLERISRYFVASSKRSGGSLMRVYRDTRFSRDKRPYKTNIGIQFRHELGRDVHAPCFYVHIAPGDCFLGAGIWHPNAAALSAIRSRIAAAPKAWASARDARGFAAAYRLTGDQLTRMPRGFSTAQAHAADLRRKDFIGVREFEIATIAAPEFLDEVLRTFAQAAPLMKFLCAALALRY